MRLYFKQTYEITKFTTHINHSYREFTECRFPFLFGFGEDHIEIRLAVNGNLLFSMHMPHVKVLSAKVRTMPSLLLKISVSVGSTIWENSRLATSCLGPSSRKFLSEWNNKSLFPFPTSYWILSMRRLLSSTVFSCLLLVIFLAIPFEHSSSNSTAGYYNTWCCVLYDAKHCKHHIYKWVLNFDNIKS